MRIVRGRDPEAPTEQRTATFSGVVHADPAISTDGTTVATITFAPGARTFWHSHERGQLLSVISGRGLVCSFGGEPQRIEVGDLVWVPPGERHWHGGTSTTGMVHLAVSLGTTHWYDEVEEALP
jgi:quercetin dioxygenase-like cupin family protein